MRNLDRWYIAWRVLRGQAVSVTQDLGPDDGYKLVVTFADGRLSRNKNRRMR